MINVFILRRHFLKKNEIPRYMTNSVPKNMCKCHGTWCYHCIVVPQCFWVQIGPGQLSLGLIHCHLSESRCLCSCAVLWFYVRVKCCMLLYCGGAAGQRVCLAWPGDPLLAGGFPEPAAPVCGLALGQSCSLLCLSLEAWKDKAGLHPPLLTSNAVTSLTRAISFHFDGLLLLQTLNSLTQNMVCCSCHVALCASPCVASVQTCKYFG